MASTAAAQCVGDCDVNGEVTVDEVLTGVSIALGTRDIADCRAFDPDSSNEVTVDELITGLNLALTGCETGPTRTPTPSPTQAPTVTFTDTPPPTATATPTEPPSLGPIITFFGLARADNTVLTPAETTPEGIPIYERPVGAGFFIVVEARIGGSGRELGRCNTSYDPLDPRERPDLQIQANRDLGQGDPRVCDAPFAPPTGSGCGDRPQFDEPFGGVPGIDPPSFDPSSQAVADALNDFGCRMSHQGAAEPCTVSSFGNPRFVMTDSKEQFCSAGVVGVEMIFPAGDTLLTVQWRDTAGNIGNPAQIILRVAQ